MAKGLEEVDWLEIVDAPDTDRLEENIEDTGVANKLGEGELELLSEALAVSNSVCIA